MYLFFLLKLLYAWCTNKKRRYTKIFKWSDYHIEFLQKILEKECKGDDEKLKKRVEHYWDNATMLSGILSASYPEPDYEFVQKYRTVIEQELLVNYPDILNGICRNVGVKGRAINERYKDLFSKPLSRTIIHEYINAIYTIGGKGIQYDENTKFKHTIPINIRKTPFEKVELHDYQKEAVKKLNEQYKNR